ncbi:MAG: dipeptide epimerase [Saprospiraceae bacterium]|nr:dipeptide epimerase [Saprospiraceae bacterium]
MTISWKIYHLELDGPFTIAKGSYAHRRCLVVKIEQSGQCGLGEISEINYYGIILEDVIVKLVKKRRFLEDVQLDSPEDFYQKIIKLFPEDPFICSALDCAAYDLYGKLNGLRIRDYLGIEDKHEPAYTSYTIGISDPQSMQDKILRKPWPIYKIKLGTDHDLAILNAVSEITNHTLRIDANEGWSEAQAADIKTRLEHLNIDLIEQPFARSNYAATKQFRSILSIPIIADESCQGKEDVATCHRYFDGINIKLMKCGGITPALQMIGQAKSLGMQIMIGCMTESSIGISAAAQLISLVDFVDLDGNMLLKRDIAKGVSFQYGKPVYPNESGLGCALLQDEKEWEN